MKLKNLSRTLSVIFCLLFSTSVHSQSETTVVLEPAKDNTIYSEAEDSNGMGSYLFAGRTDGNNERRALLAWDLTGAIPAGATVTDVVFSLSMNRTVAGAVDVTVHRLTSDWGEGGSDAAGQEGAGAPASTGDATWMQAFFPDTAWSVVGGDFVSSASATTSVGGNGTYQWTGPGLVADVQMWVESPGMNFGWILIGPDSARTAKRFSSRHASSASVRPMLSITYTEEEPATWAGFPIASDGSSVNTEGWLGWIDITNAPWVWSYELNKYTYAEEEGVQASGGWIYVPR